MTLAMINLFRIGLEKLHPVFDTDIFEILVNQGV